MDHTEALAQLRSMAAANSHPTLDDAELEQCLNLAQRPDSAGNSRLNVVGAASWSASTAFPAGTVIRVGTRWWLAVVTATTGPTPPSWPDLDGLAVSTFTIVDGDMTWIDNGAQWAPTWSLRLAAAIAWERKAAKAAGDYDFGTDGQSFNRSQVLDACLKMARRYRNGTALSLETVRC